MPKKQSLSESMDRISRLIHSTLDFDQIMQRALSEAARAVGSETAAISLRQADQWVVRHVHGFPKDVIGTRMDDRQEPHAVLAIRAKKPVVINDAFTDKRVNHEYMKKWGVRAVLVVPLVTQDQAVGVLFLNRHQAGVPFHRSHLGFANQLASSLSLAVRNACLFQDLQAELAERKRAEQALQEANEELRAQAEGLQAQSEELRVQTEELRAGEQALHRLNAELEQRVAARTAELMQAHGAVKAERQRFNDVLETLPAYLVLLTPDYHVPFANRFFRERFGASYGKRCFEYLFGRTEPCEVCETYKVLKTNAPLRWEWTGPDGRHYDIYDFPFTDTDGSPLILEMGIDITERQQAQEALQKANEMLEQRVAERTAALQEANEQLHVQNEELQTQSEELQTQAEELREHEAALRRAKEQWERTFHSVPDLIAILDDHHRVARANRAMAERLGVTPEQCVGLPCYRVVHGTEAPPSFCPHTQTLEDGREHMVEVHEDRLSGDFLVSTTPLWDERGQMIGSVHVARDITERKAAEQRLEQENHQIALANRILQVFVEETGDDVFDKALHLVLEGMESRHGVFGYIDENSDLVCPSMSKLLAECEVANKCIRYPRGQWKGLWSRALREKKPLFTNGPPRVPSGHVPIRNNLAAPIVFQGRVIGLLNLANKETDYTEADRATIAAIAGRVAPVLYAWIQRELRENERRQAEEALRRSTERFRLLSETAGRLLEAGNPQDVVTELCRKVMAHLDCQTFVNFLVDEKAGKLRLNACAGIPKKEARKIEWLDLGTAVCGCVARDGIRIVAHEIPTTCDLRTDLVASYGIQAYACHPLVAQGKVIGTLSFGTKTHTHFSAEDLSLMKTVADQVAVALERVQAQERLRRAHEELQAQSEELTVANEELRVQSVQLQESEQRLRLALEGGRMGRWEWDLATDSMFWCARTYELLGLDASHPAGVDAFLNCLHSEDRPAAKEFIANAINEAKDFQVEFRILRPREEPHREVAWLALHAQVLRDEQELAVRAIGVVYDITARKQMEAELRQLTERLEEEVRRQTEELRGTIDRLQDEVVGRVLAEGRLRKNSRLLEAFFEHTVSPLAFLDRQFQFVRVNTAFAKAEGRPPEFFAHKNYFELYPSEEDRVLFEQVLQTRQPYRAFAKPFIYLDKSQQGTRYWNWRITPLLDDAGQVQFLVFNLEDVTEQQKAFGELEHRAGLLQKLTLELSQAEDRERRRLAEVLHDDLQQVLAAAKFHLGLLKHRVKGDPPAKELADQLTGMLKEAIEKSRSLSHELSPAVLYQSDLGETCEWLARQVQAKHGLTVHTEIHGRVDSASEPLKAFLFRAAQEILFNAVKHAQVPEARLRLQRRRGRLWLTIADRGRGFDPQTLGKTTGFGLFSIRERVELLGGRMKIHSAKGRGSIFLVAVPDETARLGTDDRKPKAQDRGPRTEDGLPSSLVRPPSSGARLRILLVDDHKTIRAGLAALIGEQPDMEVVGQADDGHKAIELARELGPDVVIVDVAMPMMPGDEAARRIKTLLPQTRIVALSMFEEAGVAQRMLDAGAEVYLAKTGPSEDLLAAIRGQG